METERSSLGYWTQLKCTALFTKLRISSPAEHATPQREREAQARLVASNLALYRPQLHHPQLQFIELICDQQHE